MPRQIERTPNPERHTVFERAPLFQLLAGVAPAEPSPTEPNQHTLPWILPDAIEVA
jgi:hypothetical protein